MKHLKIIRITAFLASAVASVAVVLPMAQAGPAQFAISVSPSVVQVSLAPGQTWSSNLTVVNSGSETITLATSTINAVPNPYENKSDTVLFILNQEPAGRQNSLAEWLKPGVKSISLKPGASAQLPYTLDIPSDASPGGHYAALALTAEPDNTKTPGAQVSAGAAVSPLFLVRVAGLVQETGLVREFRTSERQYDVPRGQFLMRFQNTGTVHLTPRGEIVIYNMYGRERGRIPVNVETGWGTVLPGVTRSFQFDWRGEPALWEMGRYTAVASLAYGQDEPQAAKSVIHFWVIPVQLISIILGLVLIVGAIVFFAIRKLVARALQQSVPAPARRLRRYFWVGITGAILIIVILFIYTVIKPNRSFQAVIHNLDGRQTQVNGHN